MSKTFTIVISVIVALLVAVVIFFSATGGFSSPDVDLGASPFDAHTQIVMPTFPATAPADDGAFIAVDVDYGEVTIAQLAQPVGQPAYNILRSDGSIVSSVEVANGTAPPILATFGYTVTQQDGTQEYFPHAGKLGGNENGGDNGE